MDTKNFQDRYLTIEEGLIVRRNNNVDQLVDFYARLQSIRSLKEKDPNAEVDVPTGTGAFGQSSMVKMKVDKAERRCLMQIDHVMAMVELYEKYIKEVQDRDPIAWLKEQVATEKAKPEEPKLDIDAAQEAQVDGQAAVDPAPEKEEEPKQE